MVVHNGVILALPNYHSLKPFRMMDHRRCLLCYLVMLFLVTDSRTHPSGWSCSRIFLCSGSSHTHLLDHGVTLLHVDDNLALIPVKVVALLHVWAGLIPLHTSDGGPIAVRRADLGTSYVPDPFMLASPLLMSSMYD